MSYGVKLEVWGDYALFSRPELKVERVSYDLITPSAARGILEAIYWKPQMRWVVDRLRVLAPIRFTHVRRNELDAKVSEREAEKGAKLGAPLAGLIIEAHRQQRTARILCDVRYGIEAHLQVIDDREATGLRLSHPEAKHLDAFKRRARRGQYFHHPYLGCREFPAHFHLLEENEEFPPCPDELRGSRDFGYMLWDIVFRPDPDGAVVERHRGLRLRAEPRFFRVEMHDGVVEVPNLADTCG